jgi:hypothetical protein
VSDRPRFYARPDGELVALRVRPRLASWEAADHPDQIKLQNYLADTEALLRPDIDSAPGPLALWLDVAIPDNVPLLDQRDLDNYLFPLATRLRKASQRKFVSAWASKHHGGTSGVRVAQAMLAPRPTATVLHHARTTASSAEPGYKQQIHDQLGGVSALPDGPVALQLSFSVGPAHNWMNLWKPTIDALGTLLGTSTPQPWNPQDGRIVELGLHCHIRLEPGFDVDITIAASTVPQRKSP